MDKKSISDAGPRLRAMNDALEGFDQMRAEIERLRSQPCPYVTGNVTKYCTLTPLTLTDAEREAVDKAARLSSDWGPEWADHAATLLGLLERTACTKNGTAG